MAQDRACELGEEALDEVEPGAVFGGEGEREAARRLSSEPGLGFSGDMRRVVVQDHLDRRAGRVSGIEKLEEFDELAAAVAVFDQGVDLAGEQIDPGQQAERAVALILMIARECCVGAGHRRQIRRCGCDRLDSRLRSLPACAVCSTFSSPWPRPFSGPGPRDRRTELPPSSVRTRRRGVPDGNAPYAV